MKDTDYNSATKLEDILEISSKDWSDSTKARNDALMELAADSESVSELGVNQGTSFSFLMLQNPKKIVGVDITLKKWKYGLKYKPLEPLALEYIERNPMEYITFEGSSHNPSSVFKVDMLHIDSFHSASHLSKELDLHASYINKYIAFHDIKQNDYELWKVIEKFLNNNKQWELKTFYDEGKCGFVTIKRL